MSFHNLHLMTVALVSDIDYYGIEQVISGLPGDESFGSAMTALDSVSGRLDGTHAWLVHLSLCRLPCRCPLQKVGECQPILS